MAGANRHFIPVYLWPPWRAVYPFTAVGYHLYPTSLCRLSVIPYAYDSKESLRCLSGFFIRFLLFFAKQYPNPTLKSVG
jgi:hypothetical protein